MSEAQKWTKDEFTAYLLIYAAKADHIESKQEKSHILSKFGDNVYHKIHDQIDNDTDAESRAKIREFIKIHYHSDEEQYELLRDIDRLLYSDGSYEFKEADRYNRIRKLIEEID